MRSVLIVLAVLAVLAVGATALPEERHAAQVFELGEAARPNKASAPKASSALTSASVKSAAAAAEKAAAKATNQAVKYATDQAAEAAAEKARKEVKAATLMAAEKAVLATRKAVDDATQRAQQAPGKARRAEVQLAVDKATAAAEAARKQKEAATAASKAADAAALLKKKQTPGSGHQLGWQDSQAGEEASLIHEFSRGEKQPKALEWKPEDQTFEEALQADISTLHVQAMHRKGAKVSHKLITNAYKMGYEQAQQAKKATAFDSALKLHTLETGDKLHTLETGDKLAAATTDADKQKELKRLEKETARADKLQLDKAAKVHAKAGKQ